MPHEQLPLLITRGGNPGHSHPLRLPSLQLLDTTSLLLSTDLPTLDISYNGLMQHAVSRDRSVSLRTHVQGSSRRGASGTPFPSVTQRPAEFYPVRGGGEVEDL